MSKESLPQWSARAQKLSLGIYQHYRGDRYRVIGVSRHSETLEEYVVYQALYGDYGLWIRPLAMFCEEIDVNGVQVPRFAWVSKE